MSTTPADVLAWIDSNADANYFAGSLASALKRWGSLTEKQIAAVQRNLNPPAPASVAGGGFTQLLVSFRKAAASGLKRPRLTTHAYVFSLAPESGRNPGWVYVKRHGDYCAKISPDGQLTMAYPYQGDSEAREQILSTGRDPYAEAIRHGKQTGNCAICSHPLSDPESTARGIGPVCAKRYGWTP